MRDDSRRVPDNHRRTVQHVAESMALSRWENEGGAGDAEPGPVQSPFAAPPSGRTTLASYVRAQLLACLLVGVVCGIGFAVMDVPYAVALGALAGILEFVPLVGPLVTAVVAVSLAAIHAPWSALWVGGFLVVLRVVEDHVVYPRLIRHGTHLHPAVVIVAVLAGAELGGIAGIFLAVPVLAVLAVLYRHWVDWRGDSLPSQQPAFSSGTSYPAYPRARAGRWESRDAPSRRGAAGFQT